MTPTVLTNALITTRRESFAGTVVVAGGVIEDVQPGRAHCTGALDLDGDHLLPGLIEMHTDNVERHFLPRSGYLWPEPLSALLAHDTQMAGAGVTTVYDAMCVGIYDEASARTQVLALAVEAIHAGRALGVLRAEHHVHLRCEVSDPQVMAQFERFGADPLIGLVSVMDHTPGQRQWRDLDRMRRFHDTKLGDAEFEALVRERLDRRNPHADQDRRAILALARGRGLPCASHDDTTVGHVDQALAEGVTIAEFPTTREAARQARAAGMGIVMGAPNVVRGGSHSGNVSAGTLAQDGLLDVLSSDYMPASLLDAVFILHERIGTPLPAALATVTANAADLVELDDRGEIAPGKRADLVQARRHDRVTAVRRVWRAGERVL